MLAGLILIGIGVYVQDVWGIVIGVVGVVPVLAGIFNVCLIAQMLGAPPVAVAWPETGRPARSGRASQPWPDRGASSEAWTTWSQKRS